MHWRRGEAGCSVGPQVSWLFQIDNEASWYAEVQDLYMKHKSQIHDADAFISAFSSCSD